MREKWVRLLSLPTSLAASSVSGALFANLDIIEGGIALSTSLYLAFIYMRSDARLTVYRQLPPHVDAETFEDIADDLSSEINMLREMNEDEDENP